MGTSSSRRTLPALCKNQVSIPHLFKRFHPSVVVKNIRTMRQRYIRFHRLLRLPVRPFGRLVQRIPSRTVTSASCQLYLILLLVQLLFHASWLTDLRPAEIILLVVHICAHWNGVNGFGTKKEVLIVI